MLSSEHRYADDNLVDEAEFEENYDENGMLRKRRHLCEAWRIGYYAILMLAQHQPRAKETE